MHLLQRALLTVFPIQWPEPFGLVMVESMACGTPVLATALGAVPEVVEQRRGGIVAETVDELIGHRRRGGRARPPRGARRRRGEVLGRADGHGVRAGLRPPDRRRLSRVAQCRKWRRPVKTIAVPASFAAAMTSSSRTEPPGWMAALTPAPKATFGPSSNGKNASEARAAPSARLAGLLDGDPDGVDPAHLPGADPDRREVLRRARWRSSARSARSARRRGGRPTRAFRAASRSRPACRRGPRPRGRGPGSGCRRGRGACRARRATPCAARGPRARASTSWRRSAVARALVVAGREEEVDTWSRASAAPAPRVTGRLTAITAAERRPAGRSRAPARRPPRSWRRRRRRTGLRA